MSARPLTVLLAIALLASPTTGCEAGAPQDPAAIGTAEAALLSSSALVKCASNADCADGQFCRKKVGDCDGDGICVGRPTVCMDVLSPVCGCDGVTYDNSCLAAMAGVAVSAKGKCPSASLLCEASSDCADDQLCRKKPGACDSLGICVARPTLCAKIWAPVCGCDGVTYGNACLAAMAGAVVDYKGKCKIPVCKTSEECANGQYCRKKVGGCDTEGVCAPLPSLCPDLYAPVCGCDGVTYGNSCLAAMAGAAVDYKGECKPVQCWTNDMCAKDEYCFFADCGLKSGVCEPRPDPASCPKLWAPVCGCDGVTYANKCVAAAEGMSVDYAGECKTPYCWSSDMCAPDAYCFFEVCALETGVCQPRPEACLDVWDPVCGCDGKTYSNACYAAMAGVSVDYPGECKAPACKDNAACSKADYCAKDIGDCDGEGTCQPRPDVCPFGWAPVCGCDGVTYGNSCTAAAAGVNVEHMGECSEPAICWSNDMCKADEYCLFADCGMKSGLCEPRPTVCPDVWDPVCGCDGKTYGNKCEAAAAGVSVDYPGECKPTPCAYLCDCYEAGIDFASGCYLKCMNCGNFWACEEGVCVEHCGFIPPEVDKCFEVECKDSAECKDGEFCKKDGCDGAGLCAAKPGGCPDVWDPVCGCDGVTYSNDCDAAAAGVNVEHTGACAKKCGGIAGLPCDEGEFCELPEGTCAIMDNMGVCVEIPLECPKCSTTDLTKCWDPVCGCDGKTYASDCARQMAMVAKDHDGECETPAPCADMCDCYDAGLEFPTPCAALCPTCDNYWACEEGVCVDHCGPVPAEVQKCFEVECKDSAECGKGAFCKKDGCDGLGVCTAKPMGCPDYYLPTCGCDGVTYSSPCDANAAGVNVAHDGACKKICGGIAGFPCDEGQFCEFPEGTCDIVDNMGICVELPLACPKCLATDAKCWMPVCGCDGKTYANDCARQMAMIAKAHDGECEPAPTECKSNLECAATGYCSKKLGACDALGVCEPRPEICLDVWTPVCGCDGVTYSNHCYAAAKGVSPSHDGACLDIWFE